MFGVIITTDPTKEAAISLARVSIRLSEKSFLNSIMLLYMLLVTQRISTAAQHHRFLFILISTDVASRSHKAASFSCKLKLLDQKRETRNCEVATGCMEVFRSRTV